MPPKTNTQQIAIKPNKYINDLSVFIFKKVKEKAIGGNNNIAFEISA